MTIRTTVVNIIIPLLLAFALPASGDVLHNDIIVEHYSTHNGLPNNIVNCSLKDRDGFMWFGTWYGLCRFDGSHFHTYNKQTLEGSDIPPRKVQTMLEDGNGNIWIRTVDWKVYVFYRETEIFYSVLNELKELTANLQVIKMDAAADGSMLLLMKDKSLIRAWTDDAGKVLMEKLFNSKGKVNPSSLRLTQNVLCETANRLSWIGQDLNVLSVEKSKELASKPSDYVSRNISDINNLTAACYRDRYLYLGDAKGKIYSIDTQDGTIMSLRLPIEKTVVCITADGNGNVYSVLSDGSVTSSEIQSESSQVLPFHINSSRLRHAVCDRYDKVWFYERGVNLVYYDPKDGVVTRFALHKKGEVSKTLRMQETAGQGVFFQTPAGEALFYNRNTKEMINIGSLPMISADKEDQNFSHIYIDSDGLVWLSSTTNGIYRLDFPVCQFTLMPLPEGDKAGVRYIYQMRNGNILVGARSKNVYIYDNEGSHLKTFHYSQYGIGAVYYAMEDNDGTLWLSTKGDGLVKVVADETKPDGYQITHFKYNADTPGSISGNNVYATCIDSQGHFWVGTLDGGLDLMVEKDGKTTFYNKNNGFVNYPSYGFYTEVRNMVEDNDGRLWVGTIDGLMSLDCRFDKINDIRFETYRLSGQTSFANSDIYTLYKDHNGKLWVSAFGGGLNYMKEYDAKASMPVFESLDERQGLRNDVILSVMEDASSRIWFATEAGLSCYDRNTQRIRNFDRYDGMPSVVMEEASALLNKNGLIWMGTQTGILVFDPEQVETNTNDYKTFIVDCKVNNVPWSYSQQGASKPKAICYSDNLRLNNSQEMFTIEFSALNYKNHGNVSYRYRLEGYEHEWHYNGQNRIASYSNVPPGNYMFKVETFDESNPTLESAAMLQIEILPPCWLSWWAKLIYIVLGITLLYGALRLTMFIVRMRNDVYIGQRLAELKIKFFTNISHELRTPLTLIKGSIQELKNEATLTERGVQYLAMMEKNSQQMIQLVNQILDFRKIQNGKMRLHVSRLDINEVLLQLHKEFHLLAKEQEISFDVQPAETSIYLWADRERLETVVRNIIANAFKFTPSGGSIFVSVGYAGDGKNACLRIEDSGCGIPEGKEDEIFERFSQAGNTKQVNFQGTGIGLALSKEIIQLHHGTISAHNGKTGGAVFVVEMPLDKEHFNESEVDFYESGTSSQPATEDSIADKDTEFLLGDEIQITNDRPVVLVVDDNKDLCHMVSMQLEEKYNIFVAYDGQEALKKISLYHPDVVVTDQMMPVMDGLQLLSHIRNDFQVSHIPVIMLTAKGDEQAKTHAISMGANAYITKPFNKEYLLARIEQLLKARATFRNHLLADSENAKIQDEYSKYLEEKDVEFINGIHAIIEDNLQNTDFNIDTIASTLGLSRSAFFKKVKSLTGFAPVDFIKEFRLSKSAELLSTTDMSMAEIAYKVGFRDSGYFSKCFRKKYDVSPREYAQAKRTIKS